MVLLHHFGKVIEHNKPQFLHLENGDDNNINNNNNNNRFVGRTQGNEACKTFRMVPHAKRALSLLDSECED